MEMDYLYSAKQIREQERIYTQEQLDQMNTLCESLLQIGKTLEDLPLTEIKEIDDELDSAYELLSSAIVKSLRHINGLTDEIQGA